MENKTNLKENLQDFIEERLNESYTNIVHTKEYKEISNKNDFKDKDQVIDILLYTVGKMALDPIFYKMNICKLKGHIPIYKKEVE